MKTCSLLGVKHLLGMQHDLLPEPVKFPPTECKTVFKDTIKSN